MADYGTLSSGSGNPYLTLDSNSYGQYISSDLGGLVEMLILNRLLDDVASTLLPGSLTPLSNLASDLLGFTVATHYSSAVLVELDVKAHGNLPGGVDVLVLKRSFMDDALVDAYRAAGVEPLAVSYRVIVCGP